jgi:hypothetical protein
MFKWITLVSAGLVVVIGALTYETVIRSRPQDRDLYNQLMEESVSLKMRRALERNGAHQIRRGVQKDIWTVRGDERLHYRLHSARSYLTLTQKKDRIEALEKLEDVECAIQEKVDSSRKVQQVRTLKAPRGTYMYPPHQFDLETVHFSFFKLPGNVLPETISELPFLQGEADQTHDQGNDLVFSGHFTLKTPLGTLSSKRAILQDPFHEAGEKKPLILEDEVRLISHHTKLPFALQSDRAECDLPSHSLFVLQESNEAIFTGHVQVDIPGTLSATGERAIYRLGTFSLEENVELVSHKIQDKESLALADRVVFSPMNRALILSANAPKRVLFWQEGFSLSAPEIHIRRDLRTGQDAVEGKGDVHCTLDLAEKNLIEELVSKYL